MTVASANIFPKVTFVEGAAPSSPAATDFHLYFDSADHLLKWKNSAGAVTTIATGAAGGVATDSIWDAAGDLAVGTGADTAAKIGIGAVGGALSRINGAVAWNSGTANPGAAGAGDRYWRSDLGLEIYFDGTRWLGPKNYTPIGAYNDTAVQPLSATTSGVGRLVAPSDTYDMWVETFRFSTRVAATNDGTKFWTINLVSLGGAGATVATGDTSADTATVITRHVVAVGAAFGATNTFMQINTVKTSTAGNLDLVTALITWRSIIT